MFVNERGKWRENEAGLDKMDCVGSEIMPGDSISKTNKAIDTIKKHKQ